MNIYKTNKIIYDIKNGQDQNTQSTIIKKKNIGRIPNVDN